MSQNKSTLPLEWRRGTGDKLVGWTDGRMVRCPVSSLRPTEAEFHTITEVNAIPRGFINMPYRIAGPISSASEHAHNRTLVLVCTRNCLRRF